MASNDLNKYQKKSDKEHILDNPDMYIGSIENVDANEFIYDSSNIIRKNISYIAGLYKLFDECIVNCRDHAVRMEQIIKNNSDNNNPLTYIDIGIDEEGIITFTNDGNGIDVAEHPEYKLWIPEMIFAHLRTSTNYDKSEKKIVGGKNGYGIKLVFIWSSWGKIETIDHKRGLKYIQEFHNNLDIIDKPKITKCKTKSYTKVSFKPDYKRLGLSNGLSEDMLNLFKRRIYDIAAVTNKNIKVKLNSQLVPIKTFQQYVKMIISDTEHKYESPDERWEYVIALAPEGEFYQMSFVNGIYTSKGGKHVDYIMNQIIKKITLYIKNKKKVDVKPSAIRENIALFLRCDIENPSYESQTKDFMNTPSSKFGSSCEVSDKFIENICKMGIMSSACAITEVKENKSQKKTDGSKNKNIRGIPKLVDANYAGTAKSKDCMLILCEGDSAKAGIISGLSQDDRNYIGVYPMKGKLFNVRGESVTKIGDNKEITEIKQIIGLEHGKEYTQDDVNTKLRYSKVVFMTDQDLDGSHIKGLGINLFDSGWNSLIQIPNFIGYINTPILKASKGSQIKQFYNEGEFEKWKKENDIKGWNIKYYKGLGTSTGKEFKEYFKEKKVIYFNWNNEESSEYIDMVFNKKRSDDRKDWLSNYNRELYLDTNKTSVTYKEFIDKELIHFSKYDNDRSIPNLIDGLKISQRKILFAAFKKKLNNEIKVAQFSGYVSEHSGYHHGEASLNGAIINMAQNYVGSNNINIFEPRGQFGCIDPDTPVFMWDSSIKNAKNIKIGDKLIGDDGTPRIVSKLTSGIDEMYEISNGNMDNYIVNSHHILTVYYSGHKSIIWKNSSASWSMNYFDDNTKCVKYKNIRTNLSTNSNHFNKSNLSKEEAYQKMLEFSKNITDNNVFDINVQEYLALPNSVQKKIKGIINNCVISWEEHKLEIDPYILGLWLGDGMSDCHAFASMDSEIVKAWALWLDKIGCEICHSKSIPPHENHTFYIRRRGSNKNSENIAIGDLNNNSNICKGCLTSKYNCEACNWSFDKSNVYVFCEGVNIKGNKAINLNPFKEIFKKYNLYKNKHVPKEYIINSEENRLKILAGMIDTDGTLKKQKNSYSYEISQCNERKHLLESFRIIAGSLGFRAKIYNYNNIYTLSITGDDIDRIPVKIPRKKILYQKRMKNSHKIHNIEVKSIGPGNFCGWNIDKNERFLLGDFTITHNTRLLGGKDSASERYIFTLLNKITRLIYPNVDDNILNYLSDDGQSVEPIYYVPVIPMVLINGAKGIGTGFSTDIMSYNPLQIINRIELMLKKDNNYKLITIDPYYQGFTGNIEKLDNGKKYLITGSYEIINDNKVKINELPIGTWTQDYKEFLETLIDSKKKNSIVKDFNDNSTDMIVNFMIEFKPGTLKELLDKKIEHGMNGIHKFLKLYSIQSTTNMHLFNNKEQLKKYNSPQEIIDDYYDTRLEYYKIRKEFLLNKLNSDLKLISNKTRFINDNLNNKIDLRKKKKDEIITLLNKMKFDDIYNNDYEYLRKMPMDSVCEESIEKMKKEKDEITCSINDLESNSNEDLWLKELLILKEEYMRLYNNEKPKEISTIKVKKNKK